MYEPGMDHDGEIRLYGKGETNPMYILTFSVISCV